MHKTNHAATGNLDHGRKMLSVRAFVVLALSLQAAMAGDALNLSKSLMVTGDYVVGGIGLRGQGVPDAATQTITGGVGSYASGVIPMSGVPQFVSHGVTQRADVVAAYMYWLVISGPQVSAEALAKGTFRGMKVVGTQLAPPDAVACFGSGGGSGNQTGAQRLLAFRADVLGYLPYKKDPVTGRPLGGRLVNDADIIAAGLPRHTVSLPDRGISGLQTPSSGNQAYLTEGVSLVVVYRIPGAGLRSVTIHDGGYTFSPVNPVMTQTIKGFYQAAAASGARMTHIVGDGDTNFKERLTVNGSVPLGVSDTNPFQGALGSSWDNLTINVSSSIVENDVEIKTALSPDGPDSIDCLSWSAIVFSTAVKDTDADGLLDTWETSGFTDARDGTFVNLPAMGANPNVRDIFVELDYYCSSVTAGNCDTGSGKHTHRPLEGALIKVGDAFKRRGINLHFDVGNNYQGPTRSEYVIPHTAGVQGGEPIPEVACGTVQSPTCMYPDYAGTVPWKYGLRLVQEGRKAANGTVLLPSRFSRSRKDLFRYALFAHALGVPKWRTTNQSLTKIVVSGGLATVTTQVAHGLGAGSRVTVVGAPAGSGLNGTFTANPATEMTFQFPTAAAAGTYQDWGLSVSNGVPRSHSGQSDLWGGDLIVALGLWDNFVGTEHQQAATLMHEMGHGFGLGHGGSIFDSGKCKANYLSIMSYLFQVRGLWDLAGVPHVDYSGQQMSEIKEGALSEASGLGILPYLPRWYAPLSGSFLDQFLNTTAATRHCDGTPIFPGDPATVRVDGTRLTASPLDWNGDGSVTGIGLSQDVNFDGAVAPVSAPGFKGFNDWANLDLRQLGARRSAAGRSVDAVQFEDVGNDLGDSILDSDLGDGILDSDLGDSILDSDLGDSILDSDLGDSILDSDLGSELDYDTARSLGNAPNRLTATVVGFNIDLDWSEPTAGAVTQYQVWRAECPKGATVTAPCQLSPSVMPKSLGFWAPGSPTCDGGYKFCDTTAKNNVVYLYFGTAIFGAQRSGPSNIVAKSR